MALLIKNNAYSILAATLELSGTSLVVKAGHGDRFPIAAGSDYFKLTLQDAANNIEIVKVVARAASSDSMTVQRAQEGTTARDWNINDLVELRLTQGAFNPLQLLEEASTVAEIQTKLNVPTRTGGNASGNWAINAATATALQNPRTINGVTFDGTQDIAIGANTTNALTVTNSGTGVAPGTSFNGSVARTISYNSVGAPSVTGAGSSGTWPISVTGNAGTVTNGVYNDGGTYSISILGNAATATNATNSTNSVNATTAINAGNADTVDGYHASPSIVGNAIVVRNAGGQIVTNYLSATDDGNPGTGTGISAFITKQGSDLYRSVSPLNAANTIRSVANGNWAINITGNAQTSTTSGSCSGNAGSASVLATGRVINGTLFDGGSNITTEFWGATRNVTLSGVISGSVNMNGSSNVNINTSFTVPPTPVSTVVVFTSNGTFTVPDGVSKIKVTVVGAGGLGAPTDGSAGGFGGGGGGCAIGTYSVSPGAVYAVTVGTTSGATSSFGALLSATGGAAGGAGGSGGSATGGNLNIGGSAGSTGSAYNVPSGESFSSFRVAGSGGASHVGGGGAPNTAGLSYGGGGGGSTSGSSFAGAPGVVIVEY